MVTQVPDKILAIMAHPDDAEFTCAGTFAQWIAEGKVIEYVLCTSGNRGSHDPTMTQELIAAVREQEQRAAARELGVAECVFLGHNDGELEPTLALREELALVIRQRKPDAVVTHDPWRQYVIHPDHPAAGFAAIHAVAAARDHLYFPKQLQNGLTHHRVKDLFLFSPQEPNLWIDISGTFDRKIAALSKHQSQVAGIEGLVDRVKEMAANWGQPRGMPLAEAFRRIEVR